MGVLKLAAVTVLLLVAHTACAVGDVDALFEAIRSSPGAWNSFLDQIPVLDNLTSG
jgi:hypothetical protein